MSDATAKRKGGQGTSLPDARFEVDYRLQATREEAEARARGIALEQTVELPDDVVTDPVIREHILGRVERLERIAPGEALATLSYHVDTAGADLIQLLNVVFGNSSIQPGVRVEAVRLPESYLDAFAGPRFGREGLRARLDRPRGPLLCTALKPMGLSAEALADLAYRFALGGIDVVKDDHGLADQPSAPFEERVERCVDAVERANRETGRRSVYAPNVSAAGSLTLQRARFARRAGAGAALVMPGLVGFGTVHELASDAATELPLIVHPAFLGSFVAAPDMGIAHPVLFGTLARVAGADGSVFPNYGGRFSFSREACLGIAEATASPLGDLDPIFPVPGGGMVLARVPELLDAYGDDVMLLIGGDLYRGGGDPAVTAERFRKLLDRRSAASP